MIVLSFIFFLFFLTFLSNEEVKEVEVLLYCWSGYLNDFQFKSQKTARHRAVGSFFMVRGGQSKNVGHHG